MPTTTHTHILAELAMITLPPAPVPPTVRPLTPPPSTLPAAAAARESRRATVPARREWSEETWDGILIAERMLATARPCSGDGMRFLAGMLRARAE